MLHGNGNGTQAGSRDAARQIVAHARNLVQLELELAKMEVARKSKAAAAGSAIAAAAGSFGALTVVFVFAAAAAAIALELPVWASLLIVAGLLALLALAAGLVAMSLLGRAAPPLPDQAIEEARLTAEAVQRS